MKIAIINRRDGGVTVHKAGCRDIARDVRMVGAGSGHDTWVLDVPSQRAAYLDYNQDFIAESGDPNNGYDLDFKPCCAGLPETVESDAAYLADILA